MSNPSWHSDFIHSLTEASDINAQRDAWISQTITCFPTPNELICHIFDDSGIDSLLAEGVVFSKTADAALRRLSSLATDLNMQLSPELLVSSLEWIEFTHEAARVLALLSES